MQTSFYAGLALACLTACGRPATKGQREVPALEQQSARSEVDAAPPHLPGTNPAFPGQTRAPAMTTRAALQVTEIARGFDLPWAIALLPDDGFLVTEKHEGRLTIVQTDGTKSKPVLGVPE